MLNNIILLGMVAVTVTILAIAGTEQAYAWLSFPDPSDPDRDMSERDTADTQYTYYKDGSVKKEIHRDADGVKIMVKVLYKDGGVKRITEYDSEGLKFRTAKYNDEGFIVWGKAFQSDGVLLHWSVFKWHEEGGYTGTQLNPSTGDKKLIYTVHASGSAIFKHLNADGSIDRIVWFDEDGDKLTTTIYKDGKPYKTTEYHKDGTAATFTKYHADGTPYRVSE